MRRRHRWASLVLGAGLLLTGLVACGGDDEEHAPAGPGPDIAYGDIDYVPGIATYDLVSLDQNMGIASFATYASTPDDSTVVVQADEYVNDLSSETAPGFVPAYWKDAKGLETHDNGWTCGTLTNGPRCYRPLTDGMLTIDCPNDSCRLRPEQLAELSGMFYEALSGGSTSGGTGAAPQPCDGIDEDALNEALAPVLDDKEALLSPEESENGEFYTCYVQLPLRAFGAGGAQLELIRHTYASDTDSGQDDCAYGGTDPDAVYDSAVTCLQEVNDAQGVRRLPADDDAPGGTVISGPAVVHAVEGDYWWEVVLDDGRFPADDFDALDALASTLPTE